MIKPSVSQGPMLDSKRGGPVNPKNYSLAELLLGCVQVEMAGSFLDEIMNRMHPGAR